MARCLVLGANGFIGSHLVDELALQGHDVVAFDRFGSKPRFTAKDNVYVVAGDFLNRADLVNVLKDVDYVFHFISTTTPVTAENDPQIDIDTNIRMSVVLFELCVEAKVKRVLFASTGGAIYGQGNGTPFKEDDITLPISPYAIGKLTIENYLRYFRVKFNLDSVVFRIANPYGERQPLHSKQGVIPVFLENVILGKPLIVLGDGSMVRDYVYVKDVVKMISSVFSKEVKHEVYNIGSGRGETINEVIGAINSATGKKTEIEHRPAPTTFIKKVTLDTARYNNEFGEVKGWDLKKGISATYEYIIKELESESK